ncbi:MAG: glycosyltransferase family 2 protein [Propionibacteriaceae bacterium]|nr:glycosyltransferase family 2 protein [Propionibacteriaceae bacterium]
MTHTDGWSWFDAPEMDDVDLSGHTVTAVLVCRNAGAWLNATLAGLGQLDRRPDIILAVDNESTDDTADLLRDAYVAGLIDRVVPGKANFTFGQAVERALTVVEAPTRWIWFLHDDAIPDHDALSELVMLAARTPRLAIAVPLLVRPARRNHAARTLEIGATISGSGRRSLGLEPDEVAQGQYESMSVLGGSTCGMLVRWESLIELGGFDRCISGYRDGVDIGWRAQLIDQWVLTCPRARIVHRQAGRSEIRVSTIASRAGRSEAAWDRLMGLRLVAAHVRGLGRLTILVRLTLVCLLSALGYVLGRAPDHAKDEIQAWTDFLFRSRKPVARLRKKVRTIAQGSNTKYRVRALRPTMGSVAEEGVQYIARWFHEQFAPDRDAEITLDDLLGDEFTRRLGEGRKRISLGVWVILVVAGVALMARSLFRTGLVTASGLLGAPETMVQAFQRALSATGRSEPWLLVSSAASVLSIRPQWFPVVLLIISFPLTMFVAAWFTRHRIQHGFVRWLTAAGYASLPILMGGLNRGSLWLVACALVLPFLAEWISRLDMPWAGARSLQNLAGLCLSGVFLIAIMPALWLPVMVVSLFVVIRAGGTAQIVRVSIALVAPLVFWGTTAPSILKSPARLLLTPEPMLTGSPLSWQMLFGRPLASGLPPLWLSLALFSALWLGVVVVLGQKSWHRWCAVFGAAAICVGMWMGRVTLSLSVSQVHPDPSPWLLVGFACLLFAVTSWMDEAFGSLEGKDFGGKQALLGLLSLLLVGGFILGSGWSAYAGMSQVVRGSTSLVPQFLAQNESDLDTGTLIIDAPNRSWNIRYGGQTMWGQGSFMDGPLQSDAAQSTMEQIVARAVEGRSDDTVVADLATFGISSIVVLNPDQDAITALDSTSGLQRATTGGVTEIWSVTQNSVSPTRWSLVTPGAPAVFITSHDQIAADSPRTLVLATPPDPTMHVFVGGTELRPIGSGDWRAAYSLGSATGSIQVTWTVSHVWIAWAQLGAIIVFIIFVLPPFTDPEGASEAPRYQMRRNR